MAKKKLRPEEVKRCPECAVEYIREHRSERDTVLRCPICSREVPDNG